MPGAQLGEHDPAWHLERACRFYRWMGWGSLAWMTTWMLIQLPIALAEVRRRGHPVMLVEILSGAVLLLVFVAFNVAILRTSQRLPTEFDRLYRRARWLGILAGAAYFPIFTYLAWSAVGSLAKYQKLARSASA